MFRAFAVNAEPRNGPRIGYRIAASRCPFQQRAEGQPRILDAAGVQQSLETREIVAADRRQRGKAHVGPSVSGHDGERNAKFAAMPAQLFAAVTPIVETAEQAHEDGFRTFERRLGENID